MGMLPVGYYDLSVAGVPVHSTAFRPVDSASLARHPFRIFTSLLRLELIEDPQLRDLAAEILRGRSIFSARALELTAQCESEGGLRRECADEFIGEVLQTFRWHAMAMVDEPTYRRLHDAHRLVADVVCFKGPHINHLTPRVLDIDAAQAEMPRRGLKAKEVVEGPPRRVVPILLRQTSFKALEEAVGFAGNDAKGTHTARFGEVEQRGIALTRKGRELYDRLLDEVRHMPGVGGASADHAARLSYVFRRFPDDLATLRREGLAFFRYAGRDGASPAAVGTDEMEILIERGFVEAAPILYEDFLPVSAAGIFQSNLGGGSAMTCAASASRQSFEEAMGTPVIDEMALYESEQAGSLAQVRARLTTGVDA
jgi:uncharacterized glyoxalase superfamily metalloenzyme YdcJ